MLKKGRTFATSKLKWEHSSAGSEHLPYKQGVTGSNPVAPTTKSLAISIIARLFCVMNSNSYFNTILFGYIILELSNNFSELDSNKIELDSNLMK